MPIELGQIEAIYRYPVKSMRGEALDSASMGWSGIDGDRRLALRRLGERGEFPWLTASKLPELIWFTPVREGGNGDVLPTHVRTPEGEAMPLFGEALAAEIGRRYGAPVEMMQLKHGIFDEASISVITSATAREVCRLGGVLSFGDAGDATTATMRHAPAVTVTMRDVRCVMVNFDPEGGAPAPEMLKTVVRVHDNTAGISATVTRSGRLAVGQTIVLHR